MFSPRYSEPFAFSVIVSEAEQSYNTQGKLSRGHLFDWHSLGGAIVQPYALEHSEDIKAIVLVGTGAKATGNSTVSFYNSRWHREPFRFGGNYLEHPNIPNQAKNKEEIDS